jgi:hypothetical protein
MRGGRTGLGAMLLGVGLVLCCAPRSLTPLACRFDSDCSDGHVCASSRCTKRVPADGAADSAGAADDAATSDAPIPMDGTVPPAPADGPPLAPDAAGEAGAPEAGRFGTGDGIARYHAGFTVPFWLGAGAHQSLGVGAVVEPRLFRIDGFAIKAELASIVTCSDSDRDENPWRPLLAFSDLQDGIDATTPNAHHWDLVTRTQDGSLVRVWYEILHDREWHPDPLGPQPGAFRPTIAHWGKDRLVVFQVHPDHRGVSYRKMTDGSWGPWSDGPDLGELTAGLDALTVRLPGDKFRIQIVSRNAAHHAVVAAFDPDPEHLEPWTEIGGDPPGGIAGAPTLTSYGAAAGQIDFFVVGADQRLWKRSFDGAKAQPSFARLPGLDDDEYDGIDAAATHWDDQERIAIIRRNRVTGMTEMDYYEVPRVP